MKNFFFILASLALATSCIGKLFEPVSEKVDLGEDALGHEMIVLGEQLQDPYSVENVTKALASLYPTKADRLKLDPTHLYVRILPSSQEEYEMLAGLGLVMVDHPVDYRIIREGDYYHDPTVPEGELTWQYTVVPPDFQFPDGVCHELLDECYIVDEASSVKSSDIDWAAVEREAYRITGNEDMLSAQTRADEAPQRPSGRITIIDSDYPFAPEGIKGVMVSCNSFVKFANAYTDEDGNYSMRTSFTGDVRYRLVFRNRKGFNIGLNLVLVPASVSTMGKGPSSGMDMRIDEYSDSKLFRRAVVNNAAYDYYASCEDGGVNMKTPPTNLRIWLFRNVEGSSAVMLHQGAMVDSDLFSRFLGEYAPLLKMFLPDVTLGLRGAESYAQIYLLTVHELAHASHFMKVGTDFWDKYIDYIITSFVSSGFVTYGVGTEQNHGYCEVGEMWAYYIQTMFLRQRYGVKTQVFGSSYWFTPQVLVYLDERGLGRYKIFPALLPDTIDKESLQDRLLALYPELRTVINQAFGRYY